ncbi:MULTISPECIES: hypothetical protein [unclassified Microcoleus]|uniref:hypothetical protein n=1 Tax=unclassified Microcoleus TaxID=2642155 RepID=UPI002FD63FD8
MTTTKTYGVTIENCALAFSTKGVQAGKWLQDTAGSVWDGIKRGAKSAIEFGKKILEGGKELISAIGRGDWGIFVDWAKNDPLGFLAGGAAVAVAGWFVGSATGLTALATGGVTSLWATLGSLRIGGIAFGAMLPTLQQVIVSTGNTIVNLDWAQSDASILAELNGTYLSFLNNVGESAGKLLAGLALGGGKANPKLNINITAAAALVITARQQGSNIEEEIIEELSLLANAFIRYARNLAGKLGYLELRKYARKNIRTGIKALDDKIANWGLQEGQTWSVAQEITNRIEKVTETNAPLGNFLEGLSEGLGEGFSEYILLS